MKGNVFAVFCGLVVIVILALHTLASAPAPGYSTLEALAGNSDIPMVRPVASPEAGAGVVYTWEVTILPKGSSKTSTIFVQGRDRGDAQREAETRYPGCQVMSIKKADNRVTNGKNNYLQREPACLLK